MKTAAIVSGMLMALMIAASPAALAAPGHLKQCINHAINGPDTIKHRQIKGHTFHCRPVTRTALGLRRTAVDGVLVHEKFGFDDEVHFRFVVENGRLKPGSLKNQIDPGWGTEKILQGLRILLKEVPLPDILSEPLIDLAVDEAEKRVVGKWQDAASQIITLIAAKQAVKLRVVAAPV